MTTTTQTRCVGKTKGGQPCKRPPLKGALVCIAHGGRLPNIKKSIAKNTTEAAVRKQIESMRDIVPMSGIGDVYADLLEVAAVARQWRQLLQDRVSYLATLGYSTLESGEQIRADVQLFERSMERSAKIGEMLARLNLEERKAAVDERTAAQVASCVRLILDDLQLSDEQRELARVVAPRRMREMTA